MTTFRFVKGCIFAVSLSPAFAIAEEASMPKIDSATFVQVFETAFNSHDPAATATIFTADFVDHAPWPGHSPDLAGFQAGLAEMLTAFPDLNVKVARTVTEGDLLTMHFVLSGTQLGDFMGVPASGKTFQAEAIDILRLQDGKVVEHWGVMDAAAMMGQLGL